MQLIDLILTVCMIADEKSCRTEHLYFESRGSLTQCMFLAPPEIAKWTQEHPAFKVVRWKCAYPSREQGI
jgi:hypothetical protein